MYIGEQLINPTEARLCLSAQLGSQGIIIDTSPNITVMNQDPGRERLFAFALGHTGGLLRAA
jgi:hypothetical protein